MQKYEPENAKLFLKKLSDIRKISKGARFASGIRPGLDGCSKLRQLSFMEGLSMRKVKPELFSTSAV